MMIDNIILNIPHSSRFGLPGGWPDEIYRHVYRWTDTDTDIIFTSDDDRIHPVIFKYSRFVCDAERLENDPMEGIGQGIVYTEFEGVKRTIDTDTHERMMSLWRQHQNELISQINERSLLIDCHSFPSDMDESIDVCIGYNEDWSKPCEKLIRLFVSHFESHGYSVGVNTPYSNSISPLCSFEYPSIMIELNKKIYNSGNKQVVHNVINDLYGKILRDTF